MKPEKLTRFPRGARDDQKRHFAKTLIEALDRLGVEPGMEFMVAPAHIQEDLLEPHDEDALGPFVRESDTSRRAALDNYPRSGSQRHRVLAEIARAGDHGRTRDELTELLQLSQSSLHPRVWELKGGDFIDEDEERTRITRAGSEASVLTLSEKGKKAVAEHGAT